MALNSRRSARRSIAAAVVVLVATGFLAACGGNTVVGVPVSGSATSQPPGAGGSLLRSWSAT